MKTISIITPTYNRKHLLGHTIKSVLHQSYPHFELIIIDDGSTDGTNNYIKDNFQDSRIRYLYQQNKGQNFARNAGISSANGEFICFLDSDDYWPENKLEICLAIIDRYPNIDVIYGNEIVIDIDGKVIKTYKPRGYSGNVISHLLIENFIGMSTAMVRAEKILQIGGMDENIKVADDYSLWLRLSPSCQFYYVDSVLGYYRTSKSGQISHNIDLRMDTNLHIVKKFLHENPNILNTDILAKSLCGMYSNRVRLWGVKRNYKKGMIDFFNALRQKPCSLLPWRALFRLFYPA